MARVFKIDGMTLERSDEVYSGHFSKVTRLHNPEDPDSGSFALKEPKADTDIIQQMLRNDVNMSRHAANVIDDIEVIASSADNETPYLLTNWVTGITVDKAIKRNGPFPFDKAAPMFRSLCGKIEKLHQADLLHRDISPANVMLSHGALVLIDFGTARLSSSFTPEVARHSKTVEIANTLSFLIFLLTGMDEFAFRDRWDKAPHEREKVKRALRNHPKEVRYPIKDACERAFSHDQSARFSSITEMMQMLPLDLAPAASRRLGLRLPFRR